ncbi:hypothetical protein HX875_16305 [Pseudomonas yamanorum]|uniref:Uncharacterized protein n=2 Tax=Pseudomonas TaxID=286 RepID=A0A7Y8EIL4_9PSED|nr:MULTISPECIES: hypothetical protein [Pseudomonas]NVZ84317.1 hypothetical protein [Pseudomonas yamanorum]NWD22694.1 hypothetical protein [Pseudomonas yamanorum]NWE15340.1 hypothetical protein [Pseudomonas yamanorum]NWE41042.1 hypothetical protein [Pseudomonas yamanorum]NWE77996.1 hypothetical protein [Pseudomonas yamanorum]
MRRPGKQPHLSKSWMIAVLIGVVFFGLEYGLRYKMEGTSDKAYSWLDLTLFLSAYLFFFCLKPIQAAIHRKLCRRAPRRERRKASS